MFKEKNKKSDIYNKDKIIAPLARRLKDKVMEWIANCRPERVERISAASIYVLEVGAPRPNQMQTLENLQAEGLVGLYRVAKKDESATRQDQRQYLTSSDFMPSPESLKSLLGSLASLRSR